MFCYVKNKSIDRNLDIITLPLLNNAENKLEGRSLQFDDSTLTSKQLLDFLDV